MVHLLRLVLPALLILLTGVHGDAHASYAAKEGWQFSTSPVIIKSPAEADPYCTSSSPGSSWPDAQFDFTPGNEGCKYDSRGGSLNFNGYGVPKVYYCGTSASPT